VVKTKGLIEVIFYVQDMAAQVAFYRDAFGLEVIYPSDVDDFSNESWVTFDTGQCILALHAGGQGRLGADTPKIVFAVEDILSAREHLRAHAIAISDVRSPAPGVWVCDGKDPHGYPFSIEAHEKL
jgi:catechol 2,3-dioxygenase-like lactoylglutathione lyase family enzyme